MKKTITALLLSLILAVSCAHAEAGAPAAQVTFGTLLADLIDACGKAPGEGVERIDADVAALNDDVAASIAAHWKKVYLDPDYKLFLYGVDDPAGLPITGRHAFVVLGYELKDGEMTDELKGRCDAAAAAALAFPDSILVCSGGATGKNNPAGHTEAGLMKEYLAGQRGIDADRILTDERAMNTAENAVNTFAILQAQGVETMTIVTSSYHQRRGQALYNALAALYRRERGYSAEIVGNFCYDTEPSGAAFMKEEQFAILQLGNILGLPPEDMDKLPSAMFGRRAAVDGWTASSEALRSITAFVAAAADEKSASFIEESARIAVFDLDGTLYGELFPTCFDVCLFLRRALHDPGFTAADDVRAYAQALEDALALGLPEPDSPRSTAQMAAECFAGMTVEEYRAYVRDFMSAPVQGFSGMTYGEGFYRPMLALIEYLKQNGFTVFISSGSERALVRELIDGMIDIPPHRVIGSTFSLTATGQGDAAGRSYTYTAEDSVLLEGNLVVKNQKTNKVFSIVDEIGQAPALVFGNSSGDLAMGQFAVQHGGRAYMLLCDDTERDYGDAEKAAAFADECQALGFETVSMRDDFATIYGDAVEKTGPAALDDAA